MMRKYQNPQLSGSERKLLKIVGGSDLLEALFAIRKWKRFYLSALKRAWRSFFDNYSHIAFLGYKQLPSSFVFDENQAVPRGNQVNGKCFSMSYEKKFIDLPVEVQDLVLSFKDIVENYFSCEANINNASIWRNYHVPEEVSSLESEVFADAFHQDLVFDQYNIQLFIMLEDITEEQGPFEFLDKRVSATEMKFYKKRNKKEPLNESKKLIGKRGNYLLFTTGMTLHRAGIPHQGRTRDMFSIAFFPCYTNIGTPISELMVTRRKIPDQNV
jgi:hypothetical protein